MASSSRGWTEEGRGDWSKERYEERIRDEQATRQHRSFYRKHGVNYFHTGVLEEDKTMRELTFTRRITRVQTIDFLSLLIHVNFTYIVSLPCVPQVIFIHISLSFQSLPTREHLLHSTAQHSHPGSILFLASFMVLLIQP